MLIEKFKIYRNFDKLFNYVIKLTDGIKDTQLCFTNTTINNNLYEGVGGLEILKENQFIYFNSDYINTPIHDYYLFLKERFNIGRIRIMILKEKSCYTLHKDYTKRIHLAIKSNNDSFMYFPENNIFKVPVDGRSYIFDTTQYHTYINPSFFTRIHIVSSFME